MLLLKRHKHESKFNSIIGCTNKIFKNHDYNNKAKPPYLQLYNEKLLKNSGLHNLQPRLNGSLFLGCRKTRVSLNFFVFVNVVLIRYMNNIFKVKMF